MLIFSMQVVVVFYVQAYIYKSFRFEEFILIIYAVRLNDYS